jgi:hypothetical protein
MYLVHLRIAHAAAAAAAAAAAGAGGVASCSWRRAAARGARRRGGHARREIDAALLSLGTLSLLRLAKAALPALRGPRPAAWWSSPHRSNT